MGFVGNYAPCGLSPQTDGMPVIPKQPPPKLEAAESFKVYSTLRVFYSISLG